MPDLTSAVIAGLTAEGWRVRHVRPGATARRVGGECYEADFSSPESLQRLHQLLTAGESGLIAGTISFLGLHPAFRSLEEPEAAMTIAAWTFHLVKEFAGDWQASVKSGGGWFVNLTGLDGRFGLGDEFTSSLAAAGTLGIAKTLQREHPRLRVKCIDVEPTLPADVLAARLLEELTIDDDLLEVGWTRQGRFRPALQEEPIAPSLPPLALDRESVVLITGGACGITAEVARRLAREAKPRLILVGRSALPAVEPSRTSGCNRGELRQLFLQEARAQGNGIVPAEIERRIGRLMKDREIRATLDACTSAGASVEYHALDVRDSERFGRLIDSTYERFGRLDGVIHGAGIIADCRIRDKTLASFEAVFRTKVDSALTLAGKLRGNGLKFLVFFGSISGRLGNAGQVDYSAANEVLNKLADQLHHRWPGRVVCLNWGPWQGGMVSDDLQRLYAAEGVELISVEQGVAAFLDELRNPARNGAEVVLTAPIKRHRSAANRNEAREAQLV